MSKIHPAAEISSKAELGENLTISPYAVIEDDVIVGNDCYIGPHAVLYSGTRLGNRVKIYQGASVGNDPQDLSYKGEKTYFFIDDDTIIREFVTLHRGTTSGSSRVGKNCYLMAYSHVGHDVKVGDKCILANSVQLGGHVHIEDFANIGGGTVVHQFVRIGQHSMTGGGFRVIQDVGPYTLAAQEPLKYSGLNVIGLRRRGFSNDDINTIKKIYSYLFGGSLNLTQAKQKLEEEMGDNKYARIILDFIAASKRGLTGR